jgi:hypothetical protein
MKTSKEEGEVRLPYRHCCNPVLLGVLYALAHVLSVRLCLSRISAEQERRRGRPARGISFKGFNKLILVIVMHCVFPLRYILDFLVDMTMSHQRPFC